MKYVVLVLGAFLALPAAAQQTVKILQPAWSALSAEERTALQQTHVIDLRDPTAYALIIDNQGVNESTTGTNGGAVIGSAVGSALYIDRAFKPGNNYSVGVQLAVGLLGAVAGSTLDRPAVQQYHFRYSIKRSDGDIEYRDSVQGDAFRHPVGMCLEIASMSPAPQALCTQTPADIRKAYLVAANTEAVLPIRQTVATFAQPVPAAPSVADPVDCKLGNLPPVSTTLEKCNSVGGKPL